MILLNTFCKTGKALTVAAVLCGIVSGASTSLLLAMVNSLLAGPTISDRGRLAAFVALCLIRLASGIGSHLIATVHAQRVLHDLRMEFCTRILATPLLALESIGPSRLLSAVTEELAPVTNAIVIIPYTFVNVVVVMGCLVYLGWLSWQILLVIGVCAAMGASSYVIAIRHANGCLRDVKKSQGDVFRYVGLVVAGAKELILDADKAKSFLRGYLEPAALKLRHSSICGTTIYSIAANWSRLLFFLYVGITLYLLTTHTGPSKSLSASVVLVLLYLMAPIEAILNAAPLVAQAETALRPIEGLQEKLFQHNAMVPPGSLTAFAEDWETIEFSEICFSYPPSDGRASFIVGPLNFSIARGKAHFITGGNGSGKTTLAKLITGLYPPSSGTIVVDGIVVDSTRRSAYRKLFSVVFADYCLFEGPVGTAAESNEQKIGYYLRQLGLEPFVRISNGRFSTTALSQGQRKRLALLVALIEEKGAYLFDEWAAEQDPVFRQTFYTSIVPALAREGKAVIAITHDDRYFHTADVIFKLEQGHISSSSWATCGIASTCLPIVQQNDIEPANESLKASI